MNPTQNFLKRTFKNISGSCLKANSGEEHVSVPVKNKEPLKPISVPITTLPIISFTIPGQPVGSPRMTQSDKWKKRPIVLRYRAWRDEARNAIPHGSKLNEVGCVQFTAYMEFPKTYSKKKRGRLSGEPHTQKPDIDNICKAILDVIFLDDKRIWNISAKKKWNDGDGARMEVAIY